MIFLPHFVIISIMIIFTLTCWKPLISWWDYFIYGQEPIDQNDHESQNHNESERGSKKVKIMKLKNPIFLKRISDTLFTRSHRRDRSKIEMEIEKAKMANMNGDETGIEQNHFQHENKLENLKKGMLEFVVGKHTAKAASVGNIHNFKLDPILIQHNQMQSSIEPESFNEDHIGIQHNYSRSGVLNFAKSKNKVVLSKQEILKQIHNRNKQILSRTNGFQENKFMNIEDPNVLKDNIIGKLLGDYHLQLHMKIEILTQTTEATTKAFRNLHTRLMPNEVFATKLLPTQS